MVEFDIKTKNHIDIEKKPRVYFTCHPDDFDLYFEIVCSYLFKHHDCTIYYTKNMKSRFLEEDKDVELGRNNLFVVPVTHKLLTTKNRAMDTDIPYAINNHIPVLPLMMETGLDLIYQRPDKFGAFHYLNPNSKDPTEIPFEEKLKKFLNAVFLDDKTIKRIQNSFDTHIFLSYRKKNRTYANNFLRLIHGNPKCRDIAIWFDEFLIPGESFSSKIENKINDSDLFTVLITPDILEKVKDEDTGEMKENYVVSSELPLARKKRAKKGTDILAVEMEETDRERLASINITDVINFKDKSMHNNLFDAMFKIASAKSDCPEHNFLVGLAYLEGIDVEVNYKYAKELITKAADAGLLEAKKMLSNMYKNGHGVEVDFDKALKWQKDVYEYCVKSFGGNDETVIISLNDIGEMELSVGNIQKAYECFSDACEMAAKRNKEDALFLLVCSNKGIAHIHKGEYIEALKELEAVYNLSLNLLGETHPDTIRALHGLASVIRDSGDPSEAVEKHKKAYELAKEHIKEEDPLYAEILNGLATTYQRREEEDDDDENSLKMIETAYNLYCKIYGEDHPYLSDVTYNYAVACADARKFEIAYELYDKAYKIQEKSLGKTHPYTLESLFYKGMALIKSDTGDIYLKYKKAENIFGKVYELRCKSKESDKMDIIAALKEQARCSLKINGENAYSLYKKLLQLEKEEYKDDPQKYRETEEILKSLR